MKDFHEIMAYPGEDVMYLAPKGSDGREFTSHRLFPRMNEDLRRRAEVYFTTLAIKKSVKLGVYELKAPQ